MRAYASKVEVLAADGNTHVRYVPGAVGRAMVAGGAAVVANQNGKVKSVKLVETAATHAQRIGPAGAPRLGVQFSVREKLDTGSVVWRHHPRCCWLLEDD